MMIGVLIIKPSRKRLPGWPVTMTRQVALVSHCIHVSQIDTAAFNFAQGRISEKRYLNADW